MAWTPSDTNLGSLLENNTFAYSIEYTDVLGTPYPVTVSASEQIDSVTVRDNLIFGYFYDAFNNTIKYRTLDGELPVVTRFSDIQVNKLHEMVSYKASLERTRVYNFNAVAKDGEVVLDTKQFTITVNNDWTTGKNNLKMYISNSISLVPTDGNFDITVVKWFSDSSTELKFTNIDETEITWKNNL
jgi:hypothetical protein